MVREGNADGTSSQEGFQGVFNGHSAGPIQFGEGVKRRKEKEGEQEKWPIFFDICKLL